MRPTLHPLEPLRTLLLHRDLVWQMTERDARARYRGSAAGLFWMVFQPLLMLTVYTLFFTELFPTRWSGELARGDFAIVLFIGLLLHGLFAEMITRAPSLVVSHPNLVKKVVFPLDMLPVIGLGSATFHFLVGLAIWFAFYMWRQGLPPPTALWLPLIVAPLLLFSLGVAWVLASLGVYLRDVAHVVPVLATVLLFASPVFYPLSALKEPLRTLVFGNPLTIPIEEARRVLLQGAPPDAAVLAVYWLVALVACYAGFAWFQGTRKGFADVL